MDEAEAVVSAPAKMPAATVIDVIIRNSLLSIGIPASSRSLA